MPLNWQINKRPREYQIEALEWARRRQHAVCCLPTGVGKTLVGELWTKDLFDRGLTTHAIVLEPTRLLVNQVSECFRDDGGVDAVPIDGRIPREERLRLWTEPLVVCTAQTALNDSEHVRAGAAVIDECHHTVGQHAFGKLIEKCRFEHMLGLSATVPERRRIEVESAVGQIRQWSWSDPQIQPFVPNWIGEIYEAELDEEEARILAAIRRLKGGQGLAPGMLERYLTRDGSAGLLETIAKGNKLAAAFRDSLPTIPDRLRKLSELRQVLEDHDFEKVVVFVDRVSIARRVMAAFPKLNPVMFVGKGSGDQKQALDDSRKRDTRLIVSTSAGEEGIDLPSADLLVIWGNAASDIRFIQRLGRIMRKAGDRLKFAVFLVTPESSDFDSFAEGLATAADSGQVEIDRAFGWDPEILWPKTTWWHISESLREHPTPLPAIEEHLEVHGALANKIVDHATKRGRVFYLYNVAQIAVDVMCYTPEWISESVEESAVPDPPQARPDPMQALRCQWTESGDPVGLARGMAEWLASIEESEAEEHRARLYRRVGKFSVKGKGAPLKERRIFLLVEDADRAGVLLPGQVATVQHVSSLVMAIEKGHKGGVSHGLRGGLSRLMHWPRGNIEKTPADVWNNAFNGTVAEERLGFALNATSSCELEYYFWPVSAAAFAAVVANMERLMGYREVLNVALNVCSRCGHLGAALSADGSGYVCLSCWPDGAPPSGLVEFGHPVPRQPRQ